MPQLKILYATTKRSYVSQPRPDAAKSISMLFRERDREREKTGQQRMGENPQIESSEIALHSVVFLN